jgi:Txe/YoeB family toxin of Txe-Axe toxin-antitoxin module
MEEHSNSSEQTIRFTPPAYEQFEVLDKKGKERFSTLVQAIKNGDTTGDEERLVHLESADGKPIMTRRMTKKHRLAYTHYNGVITVLSLEDHFEG